MQVIRALPIARGAKLEELSYFSIRDLAPGDVIQVPLRTRRVPAVVLEVAPAEHAKMEVRRARYALKRVSGASAKKLFSQAFIESVRDVARFHAASMSETFFSLSSPDIITRAARIEAAPPASTSSQLVNEEFILQQPTHERCATYKSLVRASFARNESIFILVPTIADGERLRTSLERGIEGRVVFLHASLSTKELVTAWNHARTSKDPLLVIGTGSFLSLPLSHIGTIIIERESSGGYIAPARPYTDFRFAAAVLAGKLGVRLVIGDFPVRVESVHECKERSGVCEELSPLKVRLQLGSTLSIIDTRKSPTNEAKRFTAVSDVLMEKLIVQQTQGGHSFVFAARRGLSPLTVCNDCGTPITEPESGMPMVLHKTTAGNVFMCHASGIVQSAHTRCSVCGGWNLVSLGVGVQRVEEELVAQFGKDTIISIDRDSVKNHHDARERAQALYATRGGILVGTEMALSYLDQPVSLAAIASLDSLLALPEWRAEERAFNICMNLRALATDNVFIQTRRPNERILSFVKDADTYGFYREELARRERFGYPPFALFISLSWQGSKVAVEKQRDELKKIFREYEFIGHIPALAIPRKTRTSDVLVFRARALLRIERTEWPHEKISQLLASLPPHIAIQVNPQELL